MSAEDLTAKLRIVAVRCGPWQRRPQDPWTSRERLRQPIEVQLRNLAAEATLFVVPKHPVIAFGSDDGTLRLSFVPRQQTGFHMREPQNAAIAPGGEAVLAAEVPGQLRIYEYQKRPVELDLSGWRKLVLRIAVQTVPFRLEERPTEHATLEALHDRENVETISSATKE